LTVSNKCIIENTTTTLALLNLNLGGGVQVKIGFAYHKTALQGALVAEYE
jgi:hypothetical protein